MDEVIRRLKEGPYGSLASVDNGRPRVRPFGFMYEEEGKLYFCTNSNKEVYKQLQAAPYVEYSVTSRDMITVRISGEVKFCEDRSKKERALNASELVKRIYQSADNPIFKVFYIEHGSVTVSDLSNQSQRKLEF